MEALSSFKTQPKTKEKSVSEEDTKMKNKEWKQRKQIGGEMSVVPMAESLTSGTFAGFLVILPLQFWPWLFATWLASLSLFSATLSV